MTQSKDPVPITPAALSTIRAQLSGCDLLLFADIGSRTVLAASGRLLYPQEMLDALTICAAELLQVAALGDTDPTQSVVLRTETGLRVFRRAPGDAAEAFCALFAPDADPSGLATAILAAVQPVGATA